MGRVGARKGEPKGLGGEKRGRDRPSGMGGVQNYRSSGRGCPQAALAPWGEHLKRRRLER